MGWHSGLWPMHTNLMVRRCRGTSYWVLLACVNGMLYHHISILNKFHLTMNTTSRNEFILYLLSCTWLKALCRPMNTFMSYKHIKRTMFDFMILFMIFNYYA